MAGARHLGTVGGNRGRLWRGIRIEPADAHLCSTMDRTTSAFTTCGPVLALFRDERPRDLVAGPHSRPSYQRARKRGRSTIKPRSAPENAKIGILYSMSYSLCRALLSLQLIAGMSISLITSMTAARHALRICPPFVPTIVPLVPHE
jgi:hypothetical protein